MNRRRLIARFLRKVRVHKDGCWEWTGCVQDCAKWQNEQYGGYRRGPNLRGRFRIGGAVMYAHRAAWLLFRGEIGNFVVAHECDYSLCVNPAHLFLATQDENIADMVAKKRAYKVRVLSRRETLFEPVTSSMAKRMTG